MSIDTDRERTDGGRQGRRTVERLTPAAKSVRAGPGSAQNPSPESVDPGQRIRSRIPGEPEAKLEDAARGKAAFPVWLGRLRYYGLALLFVGGAAVLRGALSEALSPAPTLIFYLAWVGAAAFGGLGPGLLATAASWLCVELLFGSPAGHIGFDDPLSAARLAIFLAGGLVVSVVGEKMRRSRIRERRQGRELADLNAALRASEQKYRLLVENSEDVTWTVDLQGKLTFISSNLEKVAGYRADELIGRMLWDFLTPECHDLVQDKLRRRVRGEDLPPYELVFVGKDGSHIPFEVLATPIIDDGGNVVGVQGVSRDVTARKRAEEALVESRKKYRGLVEKINDWVWEIDAHGVYTYSSPRARELLGYAPEEIVGKTPFDFMPPAEVQRVWNAFQPIWLARKPLEQLENTLVRRDGRLVTVETSGMPVFAEDGTFLGYTGVDRDVTARKWAEEQLRRSEQDLNRAQAVAQTGSWRLDVRRNELLWSKETYRLFGIPEGTPMTYETFLDAVHPADREYVDRQWTAALHGEPYDIEHRILVAGQLKWVRERAELEFDEAGTLLGGFGTVQDITERKQAEEALRESEARFRTMADGSPNSIWVTDAKGERIFANKQYLEYFGISEQEMKGGEWKPFLHPDDAPPYVHSFMLSLKEHRPFSAEARVRRADGQWRWIESHAEPRLSTEGEFLGFVAITQDITQRKQAEQELRELNATLESRVVRRTEELEHRAAQLQKLTLELTEAEERERKRLAEILHDDLQQVLAAARLHVGLLGSRVRNDAASREIAEQAKDLLGDAIAKSRSLSHELSVPALSRSNLCEAFEWLAEQMRQKHRLTVHLELGEPIEVASEPLRVLLYKAAQELLFNVIKHAGVHEAKLRLRHRRGYLRLLVSDAGRGFDPTEPGYNLGSGLLSIRERVEYLGGRMKIRSAVGKGSLFVITVPDAEGSP
ncbi:MAG: PAS domain S-box protein [Planctomycetes bacterium]|nr:PAS domain S-box protein [Planctomycetota bacterium]